MDDFHCVAGSRPATLDERLVSDGTVRRVDSVGAPIESMGRVGFWIHAPSWLTSGHGCSVAVGTARLHDRPSVAARLRGTPANATDLQLIAAVFDQFGHQGVCNLAGDFAILLWNARASELWAIRDPFGVCPLYVSRGTDYVAFSSQASRLGHAGSWDRTYIADFLIDGPSTTSHSMFLGVRQVPPGATVHWRPSQEAIGAVYWDPADIAANRQPHTADAADRFRELLFQAVSASARDSEPAWAHLSGGLDSSSIVCVADHLRKSGEDIRLDGTITIVDTLGTGDERDFANAVLQRVGIRNETVVDTWPWMQDGAPPPVTDQPVTAYPFYARERQIDRIVSDSGGRVLLSGLGSDHYLAVDPPLVADLLSHGRILQALRLSVERATAERRSLWKCLYRQAVYPFLPRSARVRQTGKYDGVPSWVDPDLTGDLRLSDRVSYIRRLDGRRGEKVAHAAAVTLRSVAHDFQRWNGTSAVEMRYPFLNRPLVEFALTLAPELRERPLRPKAILRDALGPLLPTLVRERVGKGGIGSRLRWALDRERELIDALTDGPILAELGCICAKELRRQVRRARAGRQLPLWLLFQALSLESWLRVNSGRWPRAG